ncbi:hypothetical protein GP486_006895 [Trichoglossum hirsutum]|uniref:SP-RING-type domain-containing protein n=1 Tax=Trichoglossum hirsutum TaxID=265104 RepID=A0A9P8IIR3_9PEZI|nr:hypothetical protein GP486_006895 [Trichoglossum hirsutum]
MAAALQFASSNTAVNAFIGGRHKSWMTQAGDVNTPPTANKQSGQRRPLSGQGAADLNRGALLYPPPPLLTSPSVDAASSQQTPIVPSEFPASASATPVHSASDHMGHPPVPFSAGRSPAQPQPTRRPDIQPLSNSTSPLLANTISIQRDSVGSGGLENNQTLPSPTPSDDVAQESSVSRKRFSEGLLERHETGAAQTHSPTTQNAQPPNPSSLDKRRRTQADTSSSSLPSPGLSMTNSPGLVQGQFQGQQPHGQAQGQMPNQVPNLIPNQVPNQGSNQGSNQGPNQGPNQVASQAPNQVPNQAPTQAPGRAPIQVHGQVPSQVASGVPSQILSQTPAAAPLYLNGSSSSGSPSHGNQTSTQPSSVPSHQQRASTTTTTSLPLGYGLLEKRNQLICGTAPDGCPSVFRSPNKPLLRNFLPVIERDCGQNMELATEHPRMKLLRDACMQEDWFYVALHQMFCLYTAQGQALVDMVGLSPKHLQAFRIISDLIRDNNLLSKERLIWFAKFPSSLQDLYARSDMYRYAVGLVKDFLLILPESYGRFQNDCRIRGTPPLVHELVIFMKLQSLTLQKVIYIAVRRFMWGPTEDDFSKRLLQCFHKNQNEYLAFLERQNTAQPATLQEICHAHRRIASEFVAIRTSQLAFYGVSSTTEQNSQGQQAQHAPQSLQGSQPSAPAAQVQNGPLEPNGQSTTPTTATRNALSNHTPLVQGHSNVNTSQTPMTRAAPRELSVNTQAAQQHLPTGLPSGARNMYASSPQTLSAGSPDTPTQLQLIYLQRLRQQQQQQENLDQVPPQRRTDQAEQRQDPIPIAPSPVTSQAISSPVTATPLSDGSSTSSPDARFLNQREVVARYLPPSLGSFPPGRVPGSSRQHPGNLRRPPRGRMSSGQTQARTPLLPPTNFTPITNPGLPNPAVTALHQAHLRSPYLKSAALPPTNEGRRLYQHVRHFPTKPKVFPRERPLLTFSFDVAVGDSGRVANYKNGAAEPPLQDGRDLRQIRIVGPGSLMYRIRCVKLPSAELLNDDEWSNTWEDKWVAAENKWPEHIFIDVNLTKLEARRRLHFGKDLPVDITDHVKPGENEVKVSILRSEREVNTHYAVGVETIEVTTHAEILNFVKENVIPAQESLNAIRAGLNAMPDDDDITVVNSDLTIGICDPFSARIFDIPVRSRSCLHRECFDLETFLMTRAPKPKRNDEPCMVDEWKCPLCTADARPHRLLIDGFLAEVRRELDVRRLDETKAIVVNKEGNWFPKAEPGGDDDMGGMGEDGSISVDSNSGAGTSAPLGEANAGSTKEKAIIVIDLDD